MHEQNHKRRDGFDFMCTKSSEEKGLEMSPIRKYFIYHPQIYFYLPAWLIWFNNNSVSDLHEFDWVPQFGRLYECSLSDVSSDLQF